MTERESTAVLLQHLDTLTLPEDWISCALSIASRQIQTGLFSQPAVDLARDVVKRIQQQGQLQDLPLALNNLATLLFQGQQMYPALELLMEHHDVLAQASLLERRRTLNVLGGIHQILGDLPLACKYYNQALEVATLAQDQVYRGKLLNNLALLLQQQQKHQEARDLFQEAEALQRELNNPPELCLVLINQASLLLNAADTQPSETDRKQMLQQGMQHLLEAQMLLQQHPNVNQQASVQDYLARYLLKEGRFSEAHACGLQALQTAQMLHNEEAICHACLTLGEIRLAQGHFADALLHLQAARAGFEELGFKENLLDALDVLVRVFKQMERYPEALQHLEALYHLDREVRSEEASRQMEVLAYQRKLERTQHETELERLRSAQLEQLVMERMEEVQALLEKKSQLEEANQHMRELTEKDGLTGVYNRRYLNECCEKTFQTMRQQEQEFSVLIMDIDNFKGINDRFSHQTGDVVLKKLAELLLQALRTSDVVARYGGEEFVVVMPHTSLHNATMVAERIRSTVANHPWQQVHADLKVTLSLGVANNFKVEGPEQMVHAADEALYHSKRTGKNRVTVSPLSRPEGDVADPPTQNQHQG
ncbi:GGDEF domain-containing protein [Deinococcus roseus]|nr:tetratricopeptide repeat-containing diguanylate cyclase [Deinococcus roseus]